LIVTNWPPRAENAIGEKDETTGSAITRSWSVDPAIQLLLFWLDPTYTMPSDENSNLCMPRGSPCVVALGPVLLTVHTCTASPFR